MNGNELKREIMRISSKTPIEIISLEKQVEAFFASDAPESEKEMLSHYTECLLMVCDGLRYFGIIQDDQ